MSKRMILKPLAITLLIITLLSPLPLFAESSQETVGIGVGLTAGNMWFLPIKAISVVMGLTGGALSYVLTGGDAELTRQMWQDTIAGPYLITPDLARKSIGERPELSQK